MQRKTNKILNGTVKNLLVTSPAILGFSIILFSKRPLSDITFSLGLILAAFTGVIIALRKEIPMSIGSVRGKAAVIQGMSFAILLWAAALYIFLF